VHLVGFILRKFFTMHGHMNVKLVYLVFIGLVLREDTVVNNMNNI
jgi:hypothetical protein